MSPLYLIIFSFSLSKEKQSLAKKKEKERQIFRPLCILQNQKNKSVNTMIKTEKTFCFVLFISTNLY